MRRSTRPWPMRQKAGTSSDHGPDLSHPINESDQEFTLNIRAIWEIGRGGGFLPPPFSRAPSYVKDMINLRGNVLAIIDLAERWACRGCSNRSHSSMP